MQSGQEGATERARRMHSRQNVCEHASVTGCLNGSRQMTQLSSPMKSLNRRSGVPAWLEVEMEVHIVQWPSTGGVPHAPKPTAAVARLHRVSAFAAVGPGKAQKDKVSYE